MKTNSKKEDNQNPGSLARFPSICPEKHEKKLHSSYLNGYISVTNILKNTLDGRKGGRGRLWEGEKEREKKKIEVGGKEKGKGEQEREAGKGKETNKQRGTQTSILYFQFDENKTVPRQ